MQLYIAVSLLRQFQDEYIKSGTNDKATRRIFCGQEYDQYENNQLQVFKTQLKQNKVSYNKQQLIQQISRSQNDAVLLRFLYANQFNIHETFKQFLNHLFWLSQPDCFQLSIQAQEIIKNESLYVLGRDKQHRPVMVIEAIKLENYSLKDVCQSLLNQMAVIENQLFYPGKVESLIVIIDTTSVTNFEAPFGDIQNLVFNLTTNFPCCLDEIYIINPPHRVQVSWPLIESMMTPITLQKIKFIKTADLHQLENLLNNMQMDQLFGKIYEKRKELTPKFLDIETKKTDDPVDPPQVPNFKNCPNCEICKQMHKDLYRVNKMNQQSDQTLQNSTNTKIQSVPRLQLYNKDVPIINQYQTIQSENDVEFQRLLKSSNLNDIGSIYKAQTKLRPNSDLKPQNVTQYNEYQENPPYQSNNDQYGRDHQQPFKDIVLDGEYQRASYQNDMEFQRLLKSSNPQNLRSIYVTQQQSRVHNETSKKSSHFQDEQKDKLSTGRFEETKQNLNSPQSIIA